MGNTLGGVVAGGLLGAVLGFCVGWFLIPPGTDRQVFALLFAVILFGAGVVAGAVVGGVEDILTGLGQLRPPTGPPPPA